MKLIKLFKKKGAVVDYSDPYVAKMPKMRHYEYQMESIALTATNLHQYDVAVIATDHSQVDYSFIVANSALIVDTRNTTKQAVNNGNIIKA